MLGRSLLGLLLVVFWPGYEGRHEAFREAKELYPSCRMNWLACNRPRSRRSIFRAVIQFQKRTQSNVDEQVNSPYPIISHALSANRR